MVARLVKINNQMKGTVVVDPTSTDTGKCTILGGETVETDISLYDSSQPVEVYVHGKVGGVRKDGLLVLLYDMNCTLTICLGYNPASTKQICHVDNQNKVLMTFTEADGSLRIKIAVNDPKNIQIDYDVVLQMSKA